MSPRRNLQRNATPGRKRSNTSRIVAKRKSLRMQHSISLHIPIDELENTQSGLNCYIDMPCQVFSLTYLEVDETQNPDTLGALGVLKNKRWNTFLVGSLFNFHYQQAELQSLVRALENAFKSALHDSIPEVVYHSEVIVSPDFNPTENDNQALEITVTRLIEGQDEKVVYQGYLLGWCTPVKVKGVLLPILLCCANKRHQALAHRVLSERFDATINRFIPNQEEFMLLSTYCLIMSENDGIAKFSYKIPVGVIELVATVEQLLRLWKKIHIDGSNEVDLDEILLFHEAFEAFFESTFGIKLSRAHFIRVNIDGQFSLSQDLQMLFKSTRIIHVALKYLNHLAIQKLKLKTFGFVEQKTLSLTN